MWNFPRVSPDRVSGRSFYSFQKVIEKILLAALGKFLDQQNIQESLAIDSKSLDPQQGLDWTIAEQDSLGMMFVSNNEIGVQRMF